MVLYLCCHASACVPLSACARPPGSNDPALQVDSARVDAAVAPYVGKQIPGLIVAIGYQDRVIFERAYGKADLQSGGAFGETRISATEPTNQRRDGDDR